MTAFQCFVLLAAFAALGSACDSKWTDISADHTMCMTPVGTEMTLTQAEKDANLALHNHYRAEVDPEASNMHKLVWDDELAEVATRWAAMCDGAHDSERQVPSLPGVSIGQNGASGYITLDLATTAWHDEVNDFLFGNGSINGNQIGHYTALVLARASRVGCGTADCGSFKRHYCNYAGFQTGDEMKEPYEEGTPCAACPDHCDDSGKLCDFGGLTCMNSGTFDIATGTCSCKPYFTGDACETFNADGCLDSDPSWCTEAQYQSESNCPYMFGVCTHECGDATCQNGGNMNYKTCECDCVAPWEGTYCDTSNCPQFDDDVCITQWPASYCTQYTNVPDKCPNMCNNCAHSCGDTVCANGKMDYYSCTCVCDADYSGELCDQYDCPGDKLWYCDKKASLCTNDSYKSWMESNCPVTCGICTV